MNRTRRTIAGIIAACTIAPTVAFAMTGGEPDGNRHPNVGMIAFYRTAPGTAAQPRSSHPPWC